jgi:four helix bundle protein
VERITSHKDLAVWQQSIDCVELVYKLTAALPNSEQFGLSSQMRRAAVSIPSNIAEGAGRNNRREYTHFCGMAAGSAAELETQLIIMKRVYSDIDTSEASRCLTDIQKMLYALITKLKH